MKLQVAEKYWPSEKLSGITWLAEPGNPEAAIAYATYGNEPTNAVAYSYAAILAIILPFAKRQETLHA